MALIIKMFCRNTVCPEIDSQQIKKVTKLKSRAEASVRTKGIGPYDHSSNDMESPDELHLKYEKKSGKHWAYAFPIAGLYKV